MKLPKLTYSRKLLAVLTVVQIGLSLFAFYSYYQWQQWQQQNRLALAQKIPPLPAAVSDTFAAKDLASLLPELASQQQVQLLSLEQNGNAQTDCQAEIQAAFADTILFLNACEENFPGQKINILKMEPAENGVIQSQLVFSKE